MPRDKTDPDLPTSAPSGFGGGGQPRRSGADMSAPTGTHQGQSGGGKGGRPWDDPTGVAGARQGRGGSFGDDHTSYFNLGGGAKQASDPLANPVVGWLIVIRGKGQGHIVPIGYGNNTIGRGGSNRISLDYGDNGITREVQCSIVYEPQQRGFHVVPGVGAGLTYVNGTLALQHQPLTPRSILKIGETELMFVPLCGAEFDWHDVVAAT